MKKSMERKYHLYCSNNLDILRDKLAENINSSKIPLFSPCTIITQSQGMDAWLKKELALRKGIFANFRFENQDGLFSALYLQLFEERPINSKDIVKYRLYKLLEQDDFKNKFPKIAEYYHEDSLRRIHLAGLIADLFDQYQLYRPTLLESWDKGTADPEIKNPAQEWQQYLWKNCGLDSRFLIREQLLNKMAESPEQVKEAFPEIHVFGINILTHFHREFIEALSEYIQVHIYLSLPTADEEYKNPLLISYGDRAGELAKMFKPVEIERSASEADTLLAEIQNNITGNIAERPKKRDDSLKIASCHTPVREAECLYNYLLNLFIKDSSLKPGDVLVMCTDIDRYSPYIKAVFRNAPLKIPFVVSGTVNSSEDSIIAALDQILHFTEDDFTSEKVIGLLEQPRISRHFQISDMEYIRAVVKKANIRFGWENSTADDSCYVSWKYGLDKLLLGYAMLSHEEYQTYDSLDTLPYRDSEASHSHDLLRMKAFVDILQALMDESKHKRNLVEWKTFLLKEVAEKMIFFDDFSKDDRSEMNTIRKALSFIDRLNIEESVPFGVFLEELNSRLFKESRSMQVHSGNITFSSPIPVRSLPYKIICFLGLDNGVFPRRDTFAGIDLLGEKYLEGDRSKKLADNYLFLDTLLAAREKLYLSYTGQSIKEIANLPPSIILDTLLDYLDTGDGTDDLVVKHPIHGYSSRYQEENKDLFTYLYEGKREEFGEIETSHEQLNEIPTDSFLKFFENPVKWYFEKILGIYYESDPDSLPETEMFKMDGLDKWIVRNDLLKMSDEESQDYLLKAIREGKLPLKNLGRHNYDEILDRLQPSRLAWARLTDGREEKSSAVNIKSGEQKIKGVIGDVFGRSLIGYGFSKSTDPKNQVRTYLKALLLSSIGAIDEAWYIKHNGNEVAIELPARDEAAIKISILLKYFNKGCRAPLRFSLDAATAVKGTANMSNVFETDAMGRIFPKTDPDPYFKYLSKEGWLEDFEIPNYSKPLFDPAIYENTLYDEIRQLGELLNPNN